MKRGLVFSLSALTLALVASAVHAQSTVDISLNLRYTDPADPSEGGKWYLVAKTNNANGIAAVNSYISNINVAGAVRGSAAENGYPAVSAASIGAIDPFIAAFGTATNVLYGQDTATGVDHDANAGTPNVVVVNVGRGAGTPGNVAVDPLRNPVWNNAAVLASGTFTGGGNAGNQFNRPAFVSSGANSTDSNTLANNATTPPSNFAVAANETLVVRGDSLASLGLNSNAAAGLRPGDFNRDFVVNFADFSILQNNYQLAPGTKGWDTGDTNDDGNTNFADFSALQNNYNQTSPSPITAAPEPGSLALAACGVLGVSFRRRRRS